VEVAKIKIERNENDERMKLQLCLKALARFHKRSFVYERPKGFLKGVVVLLMEG